MENQINLSQEIDRLTAELTEILKHYKDPLTVQIDIYSGYIYKIVLLNNQFKQILNKNSHEK